MVKTITPFSTRAKEGATDSPLGDFVNVEQSIVSTADVGFYDQNTGKLTGVQASDKLFGQIQLDSGVANSAAITTPSKNADGTWPLDMTGFNDLIIAVKPSNGGNYAILGPSDLSFGGLSPLNAGTTLQQNGDPNGGSFFEDAFADTAEAMTADVWNIFIIQYGRLKDWKVLQFSITNNSGGSSNIESAFLRIV